MEKKYQIIYADPPWQYKVWSKKGNGRSAESHYRTMNIADIIKLKDFINNISDENCILFIWITYPCLKEALKVIDAWGFKYKTCGFTWVKRNKKSNTWFWGMGYWTRANSELCLIATKGKVKRISKKVHQIIETPIEYHSKKPDIVREKIIELVGDLPKIELFAREKIEIEMIPYLGPMYCNNEIEQQLKKWNLPYKRVDNIEALIAKLLSEQNIVANFQGRLEFGPRALGNRSLLADPRTEEMLIRLNTLKGREVWRPLAPAILFEHQGKYFDYNGFTPHMTKTCNVLKNKQEQLKAITHVDGTARIQSVTKKYNKRFYTIIEEFYKITGIPVVVNTSFNIKGEPIVCTPEDAIRSAKEMNLDYLAMEDFIVKI